MFVLVPIVIIISSASTICLFTYCKTRNLKRVESQVNNVTNSRSLAGARRSVPPSIYIIPTTNQVMQMYIDQVSNNAGSRSRSRSVSEQYKPPPDYGQVAVEIPPTYEEAIVREGRH
ncbi:uncharacterized protein LOC129951522 [Eupeodes corollae]|uniref:uncharacterized protein LOC129951522 n=1 Tax=Eupeodes corollae TaxID=290404 RepID=UPI002491551D|nr:uncharacterized protein LOC129951522 [Eupeodes corollae]